MTSKHRPPRGDRRAENRARPGPGLRRSLSLALLLLALPATAQIPDNLQLHGFGGWAYGATDGNLYLIGNKAGKYDNAELALNLTATATDRITVVAQLFFALGDQTVDPDAETEVDLDYAFVEYFIADLAKVRAGRVKHPFGIYTEVFNVGTVRPFYTLPQSIYGPQGIVNTAYNGVGFTGASRGGAEGWGFQYDVYGGQLEARIQFPGILSSDPVQDFNRPRVNTSVKVNDMVGSRVSALAPVEGMLFGLSAYQGDSQVGSGSELHQTVLGTHFEYLGDRLWVRAEWADFDRRDFRYDGYYGEVAYKLTEHWQAAVRWEDWSAEIPGVDTSNFPPFFLQVLEHQELALGLNYWFTPSVVLRLSYHMAEGNRFAFPEDPDEILTSILTNNLEEKTELVIFGMQFSF